MSTAPAYIEEAVGALRAFDLLPANVELARKAVATAISDAGVQPARAAMFAAEAVRCADFLLTEHNAEVDFVIGNPPYIRLEDVPKARCAAYRRACPTMRGRSDIFVGFIESGLRLLTPGGVLGFIVADRWMHNQYGSDLRSYITEGYAERGIITSPLRPWLGYFMLIEDNDEWNRVSAPRSSVWPADPAFSGTSAADRAAIFFDRMVRERLLDAACVVLANRVTGGVRYTQDHLAFQAFAAAMFGRCLQFKRSTPTFRGRERQSRARRLRPLIVRSQVGAQAGLFHFAHGVAR